MVWKMGKAKSNSTLREGHLDMPCTLLVERGLSGGVCLEL